MLQYSEVMREAYSIIWLLHAKKHGLPMNDGYGEFAANYHFQILRYELDCSESLMYCIVIHFM